MLQNILSIVKILNLDLKNISSARSNKFNRN